MYYKYYSVYSTSNRFIHYRVMINEYSIKYSQTYKLIIHPSNNTHLHYTILEILKNDHLNHVRSMHLINLHGLC